MSLMESFNWLSQTNSNEALQSNDVLTIMKNTSSKANSSIKKSHSEFIPERLYFYDSRLIQFLDITNPNHKKEQVVIQYYKDIFDWINNIVSYISNTNHSLEESQDNIFHLEKYISTIDEQLHAIELIKWVTWSLGDLRVNIYILNLLKDLCKKLLGELEDIIPTGEYTEF